MRCDQYIGLNERAQKLVEPAKNELDYEVIAEERRHPNGSSECIELEFPRRVMKGNIVAHGTFKGMFEDEYSLWEYHLPDGTVYREFVQADPWSGGPMFFVALKDSKGKPVEESLWTESEIQGML